MTSKLRTALAVLGILVGTGSVVALIMSSKIATEHVLDQIKSLGTNLVAVDFYPDYSGDQSKKASNNDFELSDLPGLYRTSKDIELISPYIQGSARAYIKKINLSVSAVGVTGTFFDIAKVSVSSGRKIYDADKHALFCDIGAKLAAKIQAKGFNPVGKRILVNNDMFTIVGVLNPWKPSFIFWTDIDNSIIIPLPIMKFISSDSKISNILVRTNQGSNMSVVENKLKAYLQKLLPQDRVSSRNPKELIKMVQKSRQTMSILLIAIGAISLLVGGIGVMNIMLVSVVERKREIGVLMAIGARSYDILLMFLVESIMLTMFGGLIGVALGVSATIIIAHNNHWQFVFFWLPPVLGFTVSVLVGVISGFYPALSASKLNPIESMRAD